MLQITIEPYEAFNEKTNEFLYSDGATLQLEHSLVSIAKWESKWNKPFLNQQRKTREECIDYVRCMTITKNVDPLAYMGLTDAQIEEINRYIEAPMTATWFREDNNKRFDRRPVTAEIIYYWMISLHIPFECQKWHLNRLLTLIRVCNEKNAPRKKRNRQEIQAERWALNEARKKKYNSTG